jgi:hypothetical protein
LTPEQQAIVVADIADDPVLSQLPQNSDGASAAAVAYNVLASPDYWVWRTAVTEDTLLNEVSPDGTTFNFQGNGFITRSAGEHATWARMFGIRGTINPSLPHVRGALADILSGIGNAAANRTHCLAHGRRLASRIEHLLATGAGSTSTPATMGYEGPITWPEILEAWEADT